MDKRHFASFYRLHAVKIYKFVYYRVAGNKELAHDLTQDVFLKAFEAFERYDPAVSKTSWIYTIARNHIINHHAKTRPGVTLEDIEGSMIASEDVRERFADRLEHQKLLDAVGKLPPVDAELIRMKYLEGWAFDELADIFGKKSGALRVQAGRALKQVKKFLKHPEYDLLEPQPNIAED